MRIPVLHEDAWYHIALFLVIEIVIIYLVLLIIVAAQVCLTSDLPAKEKVADPEDIQTGDILGVSYRHPLGWFITAWSSSYWHHTGVAWRNPLTNQLFVLEAARYKEPYSGVFRIPFDQWLHINRRTYICHLRLNHTSTDLAQRIDSEYVKLERINLDTLNWQWYRFLIRQPYVEEKLNRHYTCYEITIMLLQRLGIVKKEYTCGSYFASDIIWRHLPMEKGYVYEDPVLLKVRIIP